MNVVLSRILTVLVAVLAAITFAVPAARAGQVYKCTDNDGAVVYQQVPCTGSSQQQAVRDYAREPAPQQATTDALSRSPGFEASGERVARAGSPVRTTPAPLPAVPARSPEAQEREEKVREAAFNVTACGQARKDQEKLLARIGRTLSEMRSAEALVKRACRS